MLKSSAETRIQGRRSTTPTHHSIALPYDHMICRFDRLNVPRQILVDFASSIPADDCDLARYAFRIDDWIFSDTSFHYY